MQKRLGSRKSRQNNKRSENLVKKNLSVFQIILLIVSTIAFSYLVGQSLPVVSANGIVAECSVSPSEGPPGTIFKVRCKDGADSNVEFRLTKPNFQEESYSAKTGSDGYADWYIQTSETDEQGIYVVKFSSKDTPVKFDSVSKTFIVSSVSTTPKLPPLSFSQIPSYLSIFGAGKKLLGVGETGAGVEAGTAPRTTAAEKAPQAASWLNKIVKPAVGSIIKNAIIAATIYNAVWYGSRYLLKLQPGVANAAAWAATSFYVTQWALYKAGVALGGTQAGGIAAILAAGVVPIIAAFVVAFIVFASVFKKEDTRIVEFSCNLWDAPSGGKDCSKCNDGILPCTEYRCKSLGQSCELVNKGTNQELCVWVNRNDSRPPVIQPWNEALTTGYEYIPDNAIAPPDRGVKITPTGNANGCVAAFTPLKLGVTLDEPAKCKITSARANSFDAMENQFFSGGRSLYNHSYQLSLPSPSALAAENITIPTGQDFNLYVRCQDKGGNSNVANFVFGFCVDEGPDTTPPIIVSTSILNNMPIAFNQTSVNLSVFVNEPAECRWSKTDLGYDDMENIMSCSTSVLKMNAQGLYECSTVLSGLQDRVDNDFYFRCKDQPWLAGTANESGRNANEESYKFTLKGTEPLFISSAEPNNTLIKDSTDIIKVVLKATTGAGYDRGKAICSHEGFGTGGNFVEFYTTGTHEHSQNLFIPEGNYTYNISCVDFGGNADTTQISFNVETDTQPPVVVRVYHEAQSLKIITNENATCVYDNVDCEYNFDDGIKMGRSANGRIHFTNWDKNKIFYIKCQDDFGNRPLPNQCSIEAKPFEIKP